jgi:phage host-nuclease inhibitor protein Gam
MQALSDDQQMERLERGSDRLEEKMEDGVAAVRGEIKDVRNEIKGEIKEVRGEIKEVRGEARADHRALLGVQLTTIVTMVLGFAGLFLQQHL